MEKIAVVLYGISKLEPFIGTPNPYAGKTDLFSILAFRMFEYVENTEPEQGHIDADALLIEIILNHCDKLSFEERSELVKMFDDFDKWYA